MTGTGCCGKTQRIALMLVLIILFFVVEVIIGYMTNSMALVTDSFHKLSDGIALVIALIAAVLSSKKISSINTYGWIRAEILGGLVNAIFLIALCFSLFVESLQRLISVEEIEDAEIVAAVGGGSLLINVIGIVLFIGYTPAFKRGTLACDKVNDVNGPLIHKTKSSLPNIADTTAIDDETGEESHALSRCDCTSSDDEDEIEDENDIEETEVLMQLPRVSTGAQLNMHGVFLHLLTDTMGSLTIIVSALVITYGSGQWVLYFDPAISMVLVIVISCMAIPLLRESADILLQMVPHHISVGFLRTKMKKKFPEISAVHDFHVWRLEGDTIIATAHVIIRDAKDYSKIARKVKKFFHDHGIHSTTVQPEFLQERDLSHSKECILECGLKGDCKEPTCCREEKGEKDDNKTDVDPRTLEIDITEESCSGHVHEENSENDINTSLLWQPRHLHKEYEVSADMDEGSKNSVAIATENRSVPGRARPVIRLPRGVSKSYEILDSVVSTL
ncbi:uncharacterized protein LOC144448542 [Glandiceps talaboti]